MQIIRKIAKRVIPAEAIEPTLSLYRLLKRPFYRYLAMRKINDMNRRHGNKVNIEIGAGNKKGEGDWITIDRNDDCDVYWDLTWPMPFKDSSINMLYSSHVLEHFQQSSLIELLIDCHRILKPGGVFSVSVPNAKIYIAGYTDAAFDADKYIHRPKVMESDPRIDIINHIAYMDGHHKYMFDEEGLVLLLKNTGFIDVALREYDPALDPENRKHESIYAIGYKA